MTPSRLLVLCACVAFTAIPAQAQSKKDQEQVRRLRQQVQQLQQAQDSQQAAAAKANQDKAAAEAELKKARDEAGAVKATASRRAAMLARDLQAATTERDDLRTRLADTQAQLEKASAALAQTRDRLAERDGQLGRLQADHQTQSASFDTCQTRNAQLYTLGSELLDRYANKGVREVLSTGEPFTQIKRVQLENLVDEYRHKLDQQRVAVPAGAASDKR